MPRACVIVLDAVGAGELPDAADWGDEGSDTLGNVARAVGGLDLPEPRGARPRQRRAARGLPAAAVRARRRGAPARALEGEGHDRGSLGADGRRHADGVPDLSVRLPRRGDRSVHEPDGARRARQQARIRDGDHPGARRGAPATGKWIVYTSADSVFQIAAHEETIPLEELYDALPRRARDPHRQARGRPRHRAAVRRRARALRADAEPARLLPRAAAAELPDGDPRRGPHDLRRREDLATSSPGATSTSRSRRSRTSTGSTARSSCSRTSTRGSSSSNLVETDQLWGHRNDPVNFHRCLQDFDRRLPDILEALRDGDLLILTSDHGCDPTTPSTDHSREHALLLAYAAGRNAAGRIHEDGEFGDVGATVSAWLGAKHPGKGAPGAPIIETMTPSR